MSKPKRLGRGLEALLSRTPQRVEPPIKVPAAKPGAFPHPPEKPSEAAEEPEAQGEGVAADEPGSDAAPPESPPAPAEAAPADVVPPAAAYAQEPAPAPGTGVAGSARIGIGLIDGNPYQPRQDFDPDEMRALTASLEEHGLLQPILVRRTGDRYQLVAGERRLRAAESAGWTDVPAQVVEADDRQTAELAIVENLQRRDLNPLEKAASFHRYLQTYGCTQEELAGRLSIDRSTVANLIRLLELPEAVRTALRQGRLTQGHARALLPLGDEPQQAAMAERIEREGLSVRQTEALVQETIDAEDGPMLGVVGADGPSAGGPRRAQSDQVVALEQEFRSALGLKVKLTHNSRGRGKLVIQFRNHEEFERVRQIICEPEIPGHREAG